ncbi:MAG: hypothetical protein QOJ13_3417 [Gaiellales bacterium]|jgi:hypothetical protein|nr:hypothetical protein [Gaiellales bacterium]
MATAPRLRLAAFAGLATASAAIAHGDPAQGLWLLAASGGALLATAVPAALWSRVLRGDPFTALPLPLVVAWMLVAQIVAHTALSSAGGDPHAGAAGSLALHVLLAVVSAVLIRRFELRLAYRQAAGTAPLVEAGPAPRRPLLRHLPRSLRLSGRVLGRAPPRTA